MSTVDPGHVTSVVCAEAWIGRGNDGADGSSVPPYGDQKNGAKSTAYDQSKYMNLRQKYNRRTLQELGRPKREAARSMCRPLKQWLYAHRDLPYPTKADKVQLASVARMTVVQVSNWFANARRRLKKTVCSASAVELSWERRFKLYNRNVVGNQERLSISSDDDEDDEDDDDGEMMVGQRAAEFTSGNDDDDDAVSSTSGQPCSSSSSTTSGNSSGEERDGAAPPPGAKQRCANNNNNNSNNGNGGHPRRLLLLPPGAKFKQGILHRYLSDAVGMSYVIDSNDDVSESSKMSGGSPRSSSRDSALSASCRSTPTREDRQYEEVFERAAVRLLSGCDPGHGESDEYDLESLEISAVHTLASLAAASNRNSLSKPSRNDTTQRKQQQQQQQQK